MAAFAPGTVERIRLAAATAKFVSTVLVDGIHGERLGAGLGSMVVMGGEVRSVEIVVGFGETHVDEVFLGVKGFVVVKVVKVAVKKLGTGFGRSWGNLYGSH